MQKEEQLISQLWDLVQDKTKPMELRQQAKAKLEFILQKRFSEKQAGAGVGAGASQAITGLNIPVPKPAMVPSPGGQPQGQAPQPQPDGSIIYGTYRFPNKEAFDRYKAAGGQ